MTDGRSRAQVRVAPVSEGMGMADEWGRRLGEDGQEETTGRRRATRRCGAVNEQPMAAGEVSADGERLMWRAATVDGERRGAAEGETEGENESSVGFRLMGLCGPSIINFFLFQVPAGLKPPPSTPRSISGARL